MLLIVMRIFIIKCSILLLFNLLTVSCQKHETGLEKKSKNNRKLGLEKKNENKLIEVLQKKTDTFYQKNIIFWEKFKKREKDLKDFIDQGTKYKTINTISTILEDLLPEIAFQAGYNTILKKYEFMLSPEENRNYQTLARYWLENAPKMEGWIFYSSKPPGNLKQKLVFSMYGQNITLTDFMIKTTVNIEDQKLDIQSYHPCFKNLNKNKSLSITLLLLDEVLGEYGTELRIGTIDTSIDKLKGNQISIPNLK